ncbi:MAG: glycosyltransferase, partial [Stackebrandtia sp.]
EKRIDQLVRALPMLRRRQDVQLVVAGVGTQHDNLTALAADLGVSSYVHLLGFVPDDRLPRLYHAAELFAIASIAELQSIVTLEAMASGLPVIGADAVALPHLIHNGQNGYLFNPGDVDGIAACAEMVLGHPRECRRMAAASRRIAAGHTHEASLRRFEQIYDALIGAGIRSAA